MEWRAIARDMVKQQGATLYLSEDEQRLPWEPTGTPPPEAPPCPKCDGTRELEQGMHIGRAPAAARVAELETALARVRALPTFDLAYPQMGGSMENRNDEFGDWYRADAIQEAIGWDPTEPTKDPADE